MSIRLPDGHTWSHREVDFKGRTYSHRHCQNCGRDFAMQKGAEDWAAVYVGIFDFSPLEEDVNFRWLTEPCPGHRMPEDRSENRCRSADNTRCGHRQIRAGIALLIQHLAKLDIRAV